MPKVPGFTATISTRFTGLTDFVLEVCQRPVLFIANEHANIDAFLFNNDADGGDDASSIWNRCSAPGAMCRSGAPRNQHRDLGLLASSVRQKQSGHRPDDCRVQGKRTPHYCRATSNA
jgi:hypothetical protein